MAERALFARNEFIKNSKNSQIDDDTLIWVFNKTDKLWYSILGNYSSFSPKEKRIKEHERELKYQEYQKSVEQSAQEMYKQIYYYGKIRKKVLERDNFTCQICFSRATTKLHIHHILKVRNGGKDYPNNLITVCPKCHSEADRKLYNPDWEK